MKVRFEIAIPAHVRLIASLMRRRDREEVQAQTGQDPELAMAMALLESGYARTCFYGLEPLAMFGLAQLSILGNTAQIWCFGTTAIDRYPLTFARLSRRMLPILFRQAQVLTNMVDANDERAVRWLDFLGAVYVLEPERRRGRLFGQFILGEKTCRRA